MYEWGSYYPGLFLFPSRFPAYEFLGRRTLRSLFFGQTVGGGLADTGRPNAVPTGNYNNVTLNQGFEVTGDSFPANVQNLRSAPVAEV